MALRLKEHIRKPWYFVQLKVTLDFFFDAILVIMLIMLMLLIIATLSYFLFGVLYQVKFKWIGTCR